MSTVLFHIEREDQLVVCTIHEPVEVEWVGLVERTVFHLFRDCVAAAVTDFMLLAHPGQRVLQEWVLQLLAISL